KEKIQREKGEEVLRDFNEFMGERKLQDWKGLCHFIGLSGDFREIQDCREQVSHPPQDTCILIPIPAIQRVNVNIYDVLDARNIIQAGGEARPTWFRTPHALSEYARQENKFYPREAVISTEPEGAMLKYILNPGLEEKRQKEREEKKRKRKEKTLKKETKPNKATKEGDLKGTFQVNSEERGQDEM
ncbi:hypothetical protein B0T20DRAFT_360288, partial [Sordaria brevicollis]